MSANDIERTDHKSNIRTTSSIGYDQTSQGNAVVPHDEKVLLSIMLSKLPNGILKTVRNYIRSGHSAVNTKQANKENILSGFNASITNITDKTFDELVGLGFPMESASAIIDAVCAECKDLASVELEKAKKVGSRIVLMEDTEYPPMLNEIYDPPLHLYTRGNISALSSPLSIAIIGARRASTVGQEIAKNIARDLALAGVTIVGGFAYGIDICAHISCIDAGGSTVAVLGSGFGNIYPKQHEKYLEDLCVNGCIITEYPIDEKPNAYNFPIRNRIISGLCQGVLIVEASPKSGTLITSRLALEQGRDVLAIPTSPLSRNNATNKLIQNGAILIQNYTDILDEYNYLILDNTSTNSNNNPYNSLDSEVQKKIWELLEIEPLGVDELVEKLDSGYDSIAVALIQMELSDHLKKESDSRYYLVK